MDCFRSPTAQRKPGLEREPSRAVRAQGPRRPVPCLGEQEGELQLEDVGVLELVEEERPDAGLLARPEARIRRQEVASADEQLGEVQDARLVERGTLAPSKLDEQRPPGLLVWTGQHESRRAEGRVSSAERVASRPDRRAETVLAAPSRERIAEIRKPRRTVDRRVRPPAHEQIRDGGEHRLALGPFLTGAPERVVDDGTGADPRLGEGAGHVPRTGDRQLRRRVPVVADAPGLVHQELHETGPAHATEVELPAERLRRRIARLETLQHQAFGEILEEVHRLLLVEEHEIRGDAGTSRRAAEEPGTEAVEGGDGGTRETTLDAPPLRCGREGTACRGERGAQLGLGSFPGGERGDPGREAASHLGCGLLGEGEEAQPRRGEWLVAVRPRRGGAGTR